MPRLPRFSSRETVRALERLGFIQVRQKGSHIVLPRDERTCVVPQRRELKLGTLAGVLAQAELTVDEFLAALG